MAIFLIGCFALSIFVYQRYALAASVRRGAREALWARVTPGCDEGDLDGRLRGGYPSYESRQRRWVPVYDALADTPRIERDRERRDARLTSSAYLGSREVRLAAYSSTLCNETPDAPEEQLPRATIDTYCRVSEVCRPDEVGELVGRR